MPVSFDNLQHSVVRGEQAQAVQGAQLAAERAGLQAAAGVTQDRKARESTDVQTSNRAEMETSGGGGGGAMAMSQEGGGEERKPPDKPSPDPTGRGAHLDVQA